MQVLREFGVPAAEEASALRQLRAAPYAYPDLKEIAIYHKSVATLGWVKEVDVRMCVACDCSCVKPSLATRLMACK